VVPIEKQPVLEKRPQDTGEQRRAVLAEIKEKAGEGKRLTPFRMRLIHGVISSPRSI
jgi:hypothetical protein